jgi:hypothetical protein
MLYDPVRKKNVVATPEEGVRQKLIQYLHEVKAWPYHLMESEIPLSRFGLDSRDRLDLVLLSYSEGQPVIFALCECKAPHIKLSTVNLENQMNRYLTRLNPVYIVLTNGDEIAIYLNTASGFQVVEALPSYNEV